MKPRDPEKEAAIVRATVELVYESGISRIKMGRVAERAGLATGTLYIYHPNKEELLREVYRLQCEAVEAALLRGDLLELPFKVAFHRLVENYFVTCVEEAPALFFIGQYRHSVSERESLPGWEELAGKPLQEVIGRGQAELLVREADPGVLLSVIRGIVTELARHYSGLEGGEALSHARMVAQIAWDAVKS